MLRLVVLSAALAVALAQSCQFNANTTVVPYATVKQCLQALPFNANYSQQVIGSLSKIMQLYAFRDIVHNSPQVQGLIHVQVDIQAEFQRIVTTQYPNDQAFQEAISAVYKKLKDPHTLYIKPTCYRIPVLQPFNLTSYLPYGRQVIKISGLQSYAQRAWPDQYAALQSAVGAQLLFIDGADPLATVSKWTLQNGFMSKDLGSLLNHALSSNHFQRRNLVIDDLPTNPSVTYSFYDSSGNLVNLTVPWVSRPTRNIDAATCFANQAAMEDVKSAPSSVPAVLRILQEEDHKLYFALRSEEEIAPSEKRSEKREADHNSFKNMHKRVLEQRQITPGGLIYLASTDDVQAYILSNDTLILKIQTYEPSDNVQFLNIVWNVIALGKVFQVPNMILDVSGNGGGDICLGYQVITGLMQETNPYGKYDIIHSPLMDQLAEKLAQPQYSSMPFSPGFWVNPTTQQPYTNISWYEPGVQYTRGGPYTSTYTNYIHLACDAVQAPIRYLFKQLLLFSDGLCGSTCAVTSSHLAEADHVRSVTWGGISGRQQQYFSFPGGQVSQLDYINYLAGAVGVDQSLIPAPLPYGGSASFTLQEISPWHGPETNTPLEFVYRPSTYRYLSWDVSDAAYTYNQVRSQFLVPDSQ